MFVQVADLFGSLLRVKLQQPQFLLRILYVHDRGHIPVVVVPGVSEKKIREELVRSSHMSCKIVPLHQYLWINYVLLIVNSFQAP